MGKTSPTTTHATGPQVTEKKAMLKQIKAIIAETAELLCFSSLPAVTPIMPTMSCDTIIPTAPQIRRLRRPILSTAQNATGVQTVLTSAVRIEIKNGLRIVPREVKNTFPK
jgi:hypothetical protein